MRWIIGIELRHRSTAAVRFARWLSDSTGASWTDDFVGAHVLDADHLAAVLRTRHLDEVVDDARTAAEAEVERASRGDVAPAVEIVQALSIAEGLEAARLAHGADGVIVSRVERRQSHHILRLGDVTRRLLKGLASPVIVVPPRFATRPPAAGPVVALTSLGDDSLAACRLAERLAASSGRELALAHVANGGEHGDGADRSASFDAAFSQWIAEHDVWPDARAVLGGDVVEAGLAFAEARGAALLAVGAGPLRGVRRLLGAKLPCRLAAIAEVPLLVVPQQPPAARAGTSDTVAHGLASDLGASPDGH